MMNRSRLKRLETTKGTGVFSWQKRHGSIRRSAMPRRPRLAAANFACHVLNRRVERLPLFETRAAYVAFEQIVDEAHGLGRMLGPGMAID